MRNNLRIGLANSFGNRIVPCQYDQIRMVDGNLHGVYNAYGSLLKDYSDKNVIYSTDKGGK